MKRAVIGLLAALVVTGPPGHIDAQQTAFRGRTDLVSVDVSIRRGKTSVPSLTLEDFELLDNGVTQQLSLQPMAFIPLDVTFVIEASAPDTARIFVSEFRKIGEWLRPGDRLRIITFKREVQEMVPLQAIEQWTAAGQSELKIDPRELELSQHEVKRQVSFDALILAVAVPPELGRRQLAIAFVSGFNDGVVVEGTTLQNVVTRSETLVHVIMPSDPWGGITLFGPSNEYARDAITRAATASGGEVHDAYEGAGAFRSIVGDFRQSYLLTYTLTGVRREGWHTISVTVPKHPDYKVQARSGYLGR